MLHVVTLLVRLKAAPETVACKPDVSWQQLIAAKQSVSRASKAAGGNATGCLNLLAAEMAPEIRRLGLHLHSSITKANT